MDVRLNDAQRLLSDSVRDWLRQRWPESARVTHFEGQRLDPRLWEEVANLGWLGVGVSESNGGAGASLSDAVVLQEQLGAALFPTLVGSTIAVARLLDRAPAASTGAGTTLADVLDGRVPATLAVQDATGGFLDAGSAARLVRDGNSWRLSGDKRFVRDAATAQLLAVVANIEGADIRAIALVDRDQSTTLVPQEGSAHDGQHRVVFDNVAVPGPSVIDTPGAVEELLADAMVLESARLAGVGATAHAMAVDHAKNRVQFGRPIGSFQAIQHMVADMTTDLEGTLLTTHLAAYNVDAAADGFLYAMVAKLWASEAIQRVVRGAHQVHGGVGYITEHPLHLYFRHAATGALLFGSPNELLPAIGDQVLEPSRRTQ